MHGIARDRSMERENRREREKGTDSEKVVRNRNKQCHWYRTNCRHIEMKRHLCYSAMCNSQPMKLEQEQSRQREEEQKRVKGERTKTVRGITTVLFIQCRNSIGIAKQIQYTPFDPASYVFFVLGSLSLLLVAVNIQSSCQFLCIIPYIQYNRLFSLWFFFTLYCSIQVPPEQ